MGNVQHVFGPHARARARAPMRARTHARARIRAIRMRTVVCDQDMHRHTVVDRSTIAPAAELDQAAPPRTTTARSAQHSLLGSPRKVPLVTLRPPPSVPGIPRLSWYPFRHGNRGACAAWNRAAWRGVAARDWRGSLAEGKASAKGQGGGARQWQAACAAAGYKHGPARRLLPMLRELATLRG